jgi:hypothetical protein
MKAKPVGESGSGYHNAARILAILLTILVLALALFSKAFRFGRDCQRTIGQATPRGQVYGFVIGLQKGATAGAPV